MAQYAIKQTPAGRRSGRGCCERSGRRTIPTTPQPVGTQPYREMQVTYSNEPD
jgi:hypothetical protein